MQIIHHRRRVMAYSAHPYSVIIAAPFRLTPCLCRYTNICSSRPRKRGCPPRQWPTEVRLAEAIYWASKILALVNEESAAPRRVRIASQSIDILWCPSPIISFFISLTRQRRWTFWGFEMEAQIGYGCSVLALSF